MNANSTQPEIQPLEAYHAALDDGSIVSLHADETGLFFRQGRHGKLQRITPRQALEELLAAMQNPNWAITGDGFEKLRRAILAGIRDNPSAARN